MRALLGAILVVSTASTAMAWQETRPIGPLRKPSTIGAAAKSLTAADVSFDVFTEHQTIAYPYDEGASLGQGWDIALGKKRQAGCIDFQVEFDKYQDATVELNNAYDKESLDVTLNIGFSGDAKAPAGLFKAGGKTSFDGHYYTNSTDTVVVAHASVVNGAMFATPIDSSQKSTPVFSTSSAEISRESGKPRPVVKPSFSNLQLTNEAAKLAQTDIERFRDVCGDGFIASIVSGADLYVLFRYKTLDRTSKLTIELNTKAGAGFGGLFGGDINSAFKTAIDAEQTKNQLEIHFVQSGGVIEELPTDQKTVTTAVSKLSAEAQHGPRPIFMIVVPYSELSNWRIPIVGTPTDLRVGAARYQKQLLSAYFEYLNIRAQKKAESDVPSDAQYLLDDVVGLRSIDLDEVGDNIFKELTAVGRLLAEASAPGCTAVKLPPSGSAIKSAIKLGPSASQEECQKRLATLAKGVDFDDYKYLVKLPVPVNAIPTNVKDSLTDQSLAKDTRVALYESVIYRHWVERLSDLRCRLFFDCMCRLTARPSLSL